MIEKITTIIDRFVSDSAFHQLCVQEPEVALAPYALAPDEKIALKMQMQDRDDIDFGAVAGRFWH